MRRSLAFVFLSVLAGAALAATVFRNDIAQATRLAQDVTVNNTPDQSVPVEGVGRSILVADNLSVPPNGSPGNPAFTDWGGRTASRSTASSRVWRRSRARASATAMTTARRG